jgi:hypothetical protein
MPWKDAPNCIFLNLKLLFNDEVVVALTFLYSDMFCTDFFLYDNT